MPFLNLILYGNQLTHLHACNQLLVLCRHILWRLHMQIQSNAYLIYICIFCRTDIYRRFTCYSREAIIACTVRWFFTVISPLLHPPWMRRTEF